MEFYYNLLRSFDYLFQEQFYECKGKSSQNDFSRKSRKRTIGKQLTKEGPIFEGDERFMFRLSRFVIFNNWE